MSLIEKDRVYPMYPLNQNYIRFNHCIINIDYLHQFLSNQKFRYNNYIIDPKIQSNQVDALIEYNFSLLHIHNEKFIQKHNQPTAQSNKKKKETTIPKASEKLVSQAVQNIKDKNNNNNKNNVNDSNNYTDNGISSIDITNDSSVGGKGKLEIENGLNNEKQDKDGNIDDNNGSDSDETISENDRKEEKSDSEDVSDFDVDIGDLINYNTEEKGN